MCCILQPALVTGQNQLFHFFHMFSQVLDAKKRFLTPFGMRSTQTLVGIYNINGHSIRYWLPANLGSDPAMTICAYLPMFILLTTLTSKIAFII